MTEITRDNTFSCLPKNERDVSTCPYSRQGSIALAYQVIQSSDILKDHELSESIVSTLLGSGLVVLRSEVEPITGKTILKTSSVDMNLEDMYDRWESRMPDPGEFETEIKSKFWFRIHHLLAHPLLVIWPRVGEALHTFSAERL